MKKHFLTFIFTALFSIAVSAQGGRGIRIGYIDMEYILQNVPDYIEAKNQLELKAQKWKQEAETKKSEITKLKEALKTERVLLTKELIEEREEEIAFLETELSDFQQKRFGPNGDLSVQRSVLVKPIQDQVFTAVQDLAEIKKYDFVFDKSSDLTMLFAAKRFDMSDQIIRTLTRSARRNQMSKKEIKEEEAKEYKENLQDENPELAERQKKLDQKKADREKILADRKAAAEEKKAAAEAKRKQLLEEREAKKNGTATPKETSTETDGEAKKQAEDTKEKIPVKETNTAAKDSIAASREATKKAAADARAKTIEERKKALEEKKAKALADREAAKKAKEEKATETAPK